MNANIFPRVSPRRFQSRPRRLPGYRFGALRLPRQAFRRLVATALLVATIDDDNPRAHIAEIAASTPQSASNYLTAKGGLNGETLISLMMGFPVLQRAVIEVIQNYATDPEILDRKLAELEATWLSLGGQER